MRDGVATGLQTGNTVIAWIYSVNNNVTLINIEDV